MSDAAKQASERTKSGIAVAITGNTGANQQAGRRISETGRRKKTDFSRDGRNRGVENHLL